MKKFFFVVVIAITMAAGNSAKAQTKIGYIRIDDIVGLMPELAPEKVNMDTVGAKFIRDSIMPEINYKQDEYNKKIADLSDTTKKLAESVKKVMLQDIQELQSYLGQADQYIQQVQQVKQQEFLRPYYAKAKKAIEQVAKEKGYTHVLSTDSFIVAPEADDLSLAVLAKLGIKLPQQEKATPAKPAGKN